MDPRRVPHALAAAVACITLAVFLPSLGNDFVHWDDYQTVVNNHHIHSLGRDMLLWAATDLTFNLWQPGAWVSHAIDYALWGLDPAGHHLSGILLHALNTFLVIIVVIRLLEAAVSRPVPAREGGGEGAQRGPVPSRKGSFIAAGVAGALFGLHPVHVEPAVWITGRTDLVCALFYLLAVLAYLRHAFLPGDRPAYQDVLPLLCTREYILSFLFFILALTGKPAPITLPVVLLLLDWYPLHRIRSWKDLRPALIEKLPFILVSIAVSWVTMMSQKGIAASGMPGTEFFLAQASVSAEALTAYLGKLLLPFHLFPVYPFPKDAGSLSLNALGAVGLGAGLTAAGIFMARKRPVVTVAWFFFLISIFPTLGLVGVRTSFMADRYLYLPSIGLFLLAGLAAARTWEKADLMKQGGRTAKRIAMATALLLCLLMVSLTIRQIFIWKDSMALWNNVIENSSRGVPAAYANRGLVYREQGRLERALEDYTAAITLDPAYADAYIGRGNVLRDMGRHERAQVDYSTAIELDPSPVAYANRGMASGETGQLDDALSDLDSAIALDTTYADAYIGRGVVFEQRGELLRAKEDYDKAILLNPDNALAYENRSIVHAKMGRIDKAIEDLTRVLFLKPDDRRAYLERGELFLKAGNDAFAERDFKKAREPAR